MNRTSIRVDIDGEAANAGAPDDVDEVDDVAVGDRPVGGDESLEVRISRELGADEAQDGVVVEGAPFRNSAPCRVSVNPRDVRCCSVPLAALGRSTRMAGLTM